MKIETIIGRVARRTMSQKHAIYLIKEDVKTLVGESFFDTADSNGNKFRFIKAGATKKGDQAFSKAKRAWVDIPPAFVGVDVKTFFRIRRLFSRR